MHIEFELDEHDLKHFELIMRESRQAAARTTPERIVDGARKLLDGIRKSRTPDFISRSLDRLELMIAMLSDHEWQLPERDAAHVLDALAYFCEPEDLIPDHIPGVGYLDDAIMIALAERELQAEIEAYQDFCTFRDSQPPERSVKLRSSAATREAWLASRRDELQQRMRKRRKSICKR